MKKIFFISAIIFIFYFRIVNAQEFQQIITISPEDQQCTNNRDCTVVETDCNQEACECGGKPINVTSKQKYLTFLKECRQSQKFPIVMCDRSCEPTYEKCANGECVIFQTDSAEMPKLKQNEVKKSANSLALNEGYNLDEYREPEIIFAPEEKEWQLFYDQKYIRDPETGELDGAPGKHFMIDINDLTGKANLMRGM
jgi:hypothetical protein